jgi:hypothetical protein
MKKFQKAVELISAKNHSCDSKQFKSFYLPMAEIFYYY